MSKKAFLSANEAAAHGVRLAKPQIVSAYPITPQTTLVEKIADFIADGESDIDYIMVESEHSAMAAAFGASLMGSRVFTASSSNGLLYMVEMLHYVSGARCPIVMVDANRATAAPWNIYGDQRDSMSQRDAGWIMLYVESGQEALDTILQAYKVAEDPEIMTPVMVNLDGFTLTHTYDVVEMPEQEDVDKYLPPYVTDYKMDPAKPITMAATTGPDFHTENRAQQQIAMMKAAEKIIKADEEFKAQFGRGYGGLVEEYRCEDAEVVLVATGAVAGTTRIVVDKLREEGKKVGMIKLRCFRPFPKEFFHSIIDRFKAVGVIDRSVSFGSEGTIFAEVKGAMYGSKAKMGNYLVGFGGRDIPREQIEEMYVRLFDMVENGKDEEVEFLGLRW